MRALFALTFASLVVAGLLPPARADVCVSLEPPYVQASDPCGESVVPADIAVTWDDEGVHATACERLDEVLSIVQRHCVQVDVRVVVGRFVLYLP